MCKQVSLSKFNNLCKTLLIFNAVTANVYIFATALGDKLGIQSNKTNTHYGRNEKHPLGRDKIDMTLTIEFFVLCETFSSVQ